MRSNRGGLFWGRFAALRGQVRTPSGQKRVMCADRATLRLCRSGLVRELPGTGSKTGIHGTSEATEVACFRAASQP
ncbi:hypothetical protein ALO40_05402, partial [Pseudomonas syringae pv. viburni]